MDQRKSSWDPDSRTPSARGLLESRHAQMLQWANSLTRGDESLAAEIVQDLCLQLTISSPNFDRVENLDGYLYTCLRHLYLSRLTRASREAVRFVSIEDNDSIQFARDNGHLPDSVDVQNQLRRICSYSLWRREDSKIFSCFILHFFHGYFHREIADVACLPMPAVYNKLKAARTEIKSHLREPEKLQFLNRRVPPEPRLSWTAIPSAALFRELRETVMGARVGACLPEVELLSWYSSPSTGPIPCALLAHIVSCERCLALIDRHFQRPSLEDRDALDGYDRELRMPSNIHAIQGPLERRRRRVYEHRPITLSIAVNGRIVASHNMQGERSVLSARIERPESAQFVEVFSEQDVRLALVPVEALPPKGADLRISRVDLSDDRWLELHVAFDGLGLSSELAYCDPALAVQSFEEEQGEALVRYTPTAKQVTGMPPPAREKRSGLTRLWGWLWPSSVPAWTLAILCLMMTGAWIAWRIAKRPLTADAILQKSIASEAAALKGHAEHEVFLCEQFDVDGHLAAHGTVDVWKDGSSGRTMRRLYDANHHLVAATWRLQNGTTGSYSVKSGVGASKADRELAGTGVWSQDVSPEAFRSLAAESVHGGATDEGYELTEAVHDARSPQVVSATLIINRQFRPVGEILRIRSGAGYAEVRYRETTFESEPASNVPDAVFDPGNLENGVPRRRSSLKQEVNPFAGTDAESAKLEIAVLYRLFELHADADQPIQVERTPQHRVRVEGSVASDATRREIVHALNVVPGHDALDVHILSPGKQQPTGRRAQAVGRQTATVYTVFQAKAPADLALRQYLAARGESGARMENAIAALERGTVNQAQQALQQAYTLNRLGTTFSADELRALPEDGRREWAEMAAAHAQALREDLLALEQRLSGLVPHPGAASSAELSEKAVGDPEAFAHVTTRMLEQVQTMNRRISAAFTSTADGGAQNPDAKQADALLAAAVDSIPLTEAQAISELAMRLDNPTGSDGKSATATARRNP